MLYGHSWGTILALDSLTGFGAAPATGVKGAILAGPALSIPRWAEDAKRLIATLTPEEQGAIEEGGRTGDTRGEAYQGAMQSFYARCGCRCDPWPRGAAPRLARPAGL